MGGRGFSGFGRSAVAAGVAAGFMAVLGLFLLPGLAAAQVHNMVGPQATTAPAQAPGTGSPGATIVAPAPAAVVPPPVPPVAQAAPAAPAGNVLLAVVARYGQNAPPIGAGLIWRVYAARPDSPGNFRLIKEDRAAAPPGTQIPTRRSGK